MKRTKHDRTVIILSAVALAIILLLVGMMLFYLGVVHAEVKHLQSTAATMQEDTEDAPDAPTETSALSYKESFLLGGQLYRLRQAIRGNANIPTAISMEFNTVYVDLFQRSMNGEEIKADDMKALNDVLQKIGVEGNVFPEEDAEADAFYSGMMFFIYDEVIQQLYAAGYVDKQVMLDYGAESDEVLAQITPEGVAAMLQEMEEIVGDVKIPDQTTTLPVSGERV